MAIISNREFVKKYMEVWNTGGSLSDIALYFNAESSTISSKASALRRAGVRLPRFKGRPMTGAAIDVLNAIVDGSR